MNDILNQRINQRLDLYKSVDDRLKNKLIIAIDLLVGSIESNKILIFGNGGSATQASHFAAELVNRYYMNRPAIPALALTTDTANITSIANDFQFEDIFARQIEAIGLPGDIAFGISTSGKSENVLRGISRARKMGLKTIVLSGADTSILQKQKVDLIIDVNSTDTPCIQEMHLFIIHFISEQLEAIRFPDRNG